MFIPAILPRTARVAVGDDGDRPSMGRNDLMYECTRCSERLLHHEYVPVGRVEEEYAQQGEFARQW